MKKRIFKNFARMSLVFAALLQTNFSWAASPVEQGLKAWSGVRLMTVGTYYMLNVPKDAADWIKSDPNSFVPSSISGDAVELSKTLIEGLRNSGKILVLAGVAKEYNTLFNYKSDPDNPLNGVTAAQVTDYQNGRLTKISTDLAVLEKGLDDDKLDTSWLKILFASGIQQVTQESLKGGLEAFGTILNRFNIYGVGIEIVSDIPIGSIVTSVLSKWIPEGVQKYSDGVSYQQMQGVLYLLKNDGAENRYAASSFGQGGVRAQASVLTRGQSHNTGEANFSVRVTLLASSSRLANFEATNLNNTMISELTLNNNLVNSLPEALRGIVKQAQEALDKSNKFAFLKENVRLAFGYIKNWSGSGDTPEALIRFSVGNYAKAVEGKGFSGWIEPSATFGRLSVEKVK